MKEWREGWALAVDLRHSRLAREDVLRTIAGSWPSAKLEGFLFAHEAALVHQRCTCLHCPIHHDNERERSTDEN